MRQAVLAAPKALSWREEATPQPGKGEVVVKVRAALTCGTDLKTYRRGHPKLAFGPFGHEASGDIAAVGDGVSGFKSGDPVMWVQSAPCGACPSCQVGMENLCQVLLDDMALGAYADFVRLPARVVAWNLYHKPEKLSYIEAAFLEPFSCVVHGWNVLCRANARACLPSSLAIIGAGTIGLLHLAYAKHLGIRTTVIARHTERLELAKRLGAAEIVAAHGYVRKSGAPRAYVETPDSLAASFPAVIECGGTPESWHEAVRIAAKGGRVLFFSGLSEGSEVSLDATRIHYDELTCLGSFHFTPQDVREASELLVAGAVPARELISSILPLASLADAFTLLDRREGYKYALIPWPDVPRWI